MKNKTAYRNSLTTLAATLLFSSIAIGSHVNLAMAGLSGNSLRIENLAQFNTDEEDEDSSPQVASNKKRSMQYYQRGVKLQKQGDDESAFENYYKALELDPENGHAWLVIGATLCEKGNTKLGIKSLKVAAQLLKGQGDSECYEIAVSLLQKLGVED